MGSQAYYFWHCTVNPQSFSKVMHTKLYVNLKPLSKKKKKKKKELLFLFQKTLSKTLL